MNLARSIMLLAALLSAALVGDVHAQALSEAQLQTVLDEAQDAYTRGLSLRASDPAAAMDAFERSVDRFMVLIDDGHATGSLLYNLANAQVQAGSLGAAIATYLKADRLMPGDGRIAENLAHARSLVRTRVASDGGDALVDRLVFWHDWSATTRLVLFTIAWCTLWGVLIMACWRRVPGLRTTASLSALASVVLGVSLLWPMLAGEQAAGVLVQDDVIVRKGDSTAFEPQFETPIHQGVEFRVLESRPNWLHIELPDGQNGWVPRDAAEVVGGPDDWTHRSGMTLAGQQPASAA
ncbi:MAG: SH3 domain-containing protein [Phycisphaerales bacterium]|nr:SH3 domain-containing protein [Phycisphaerales bacterium]